MEIIVKTTRGQIIADLGESFKDLKAGIQDLNEKGADLRNADLSRADLIDADLSRADLRNADLSRADLIGSNLSRADLSGADLSRADLSFADLRNADLSGAKLTDANLSGADLRNADLSGAKLTDANLSGADLSGAKGLMDVILFLENNFTWTNEGMIAYKVFGGGYNSPDGWEIKPGSIISENVNRCAADTCGCGVNVGTLGWVTKEYGHKGDVWKVLIRTPWLASVVVPYNTDGKIRTQKAELIEIAIKKTNRK